MGLTGFNLRRTLQAKAAREAAEQAKAAQDAAADNDKTETPPKSAERKTAAKKKA